MKQATFSWETFLRMPVVGILRGISMEQIKEILPRYRDAGLGTVEITMNTPDAQEIISYASELFAGSLNVGAGTVCSLSDLDAAVAAGARFVVTPITDEEVIKNCVEKKIPVFPGAFTPTEIYRAWQCGADMIKVFPASAQGPAYIREIKGPLDQIKLLPTGGVTIENCAQFLEAGASGLGIGGQLFHKEFISRRDWKSLSTHFRRFAGKVQSAVKPGRDNPL